MRGHRDALAFKTDQPTQYVLKFVISKGGTGGRDRNFRSVLSVRVVFNSTSPSYSLFSLKENNSSLSSVIILLFACKKAFHG